MITNIQIPSLQGNTVASDLELNQPGDESFLSILEDISNKSVPQSLAVDECETNIFLHNDLDNHNINILTIPNIDNNIHIARNTEIDNNIVNITDIDHNQLITDDLVLIKPCELNFNYSNDNLPTLNIVSDHISLEISTAEVVAFLTSKYNLNIEFDTIDDSHYSVANDILLNSNVLFDPKMYDENLLTVAIKDNIEDFNDTNYSIPLFHLNNITEYHIDLEQDLINNQDDHRIIDDKSQNYTSDANEYIIGSIPCAIELITYNPIDYIVKFEDFVSVNSIANLYNAEPNGTEMGRAITKQIINSINTKITDNTITIQLNPQSLGKITITCYKHNNELDINIEAENHNTMHLISTHLHEIQHYINSLEYVEETSVKIKEKKRSLLDVYNLIELIT